MGAIFRREMKAYFTSPVAYIFIAAFYLLAEHNLRKPYCHIFIYTFFIDKLLVNNLEIFIDMTCT